MNFLMTVFLLIFSTVSVAQPTQVETREPPKFSPAKEHKPIAKPKAYQRVAILSILLKYEKGEVVGAELMHSKRVASVAPKVFVRKMGDWQVTIGNNQKASFFVNDPGFLEAENRPGDKIPYHYVSRGNEVEWNLIVPLYKDGEALDAPTVTIKRVKDGKMILHTKI